MIRLKLHNNAVSRVYLLFALDLFHANWDRELKLSAVICIVCWILSIESEARWTFLLVIVDVDVIAWNMKNVRTI